MKRAAIILTVLTLPSSSAFASSSPFSDVPAGHWAYNSVEKLTSLGIIEGYGDETYRGDRKITRYEMAQMIAKALAKNPQGDDKLELKRLAAEFSNELKSFDSRIEKLEKFSDKLEMHGELCYTFFNEHHDKRPTRFLNGSHKTVNDWLVRVNMVANIDDNWALKARFESNFDPSKDETTLGPRFERFWAEGNYDDLTIRFGKIFYYSTFENGFMFDTEFVGGQLEYGSKWKTHLTAGRIAGRSTYYNDVVYDNDGDGFYETHLLNESNSDLKGIEFKYADSRWNGGLGYFVMENSGFEKVMRSHKARLWDIGLNYRFDKNVLLQAAYVKNTSMQDKWDRHKASRSYSIQLTYKGFKFEEPGSYTLWLAYRSMGYISAIKTLYKDVMFPGQQGWEIGTYYTFFPNIVSTFEYFYGKDKEYKSSEGNASKFLFCTEFFF